MSSKAARVAAVSFTLVAVWIMVAGGSMAETFPKAVRGYVFDSEGRAIEDADVTINIKDGPTIIDTDAQTTDGNGFYSLTFYEDWEEGDYTIEVIANYLSHQESNSTSATSAPVQYINVSFAFEIPEFGSTAGLIITGGLVGAIAVVALVFFRKR